MSEPRWAEPRNVCLWKNPVGGTPTEGNYEQAAAELAAALRQE